MSECSLLSASIHRKMPPGSIGRPLENVEIRFENGEILKRYKCYERVLSDAGRETAETLKDGWCILATRVIWMKMGYLFINGRSKKI